MEVKGGVWVLYDGEGTHSRSATTMQARVSMLLEGRLTEDDGGSRQVRRTYMRTATTMHAHKSEGSRTQE